MSNKESLIVLQHLFYKSPLTKKKKFPIKTMNTWNNITSSTAVILFK